MDTLLDLPELFEEELASPALRAATSDFFSIVDCMLLEDEPTVAAAVSGTCTPTPIMACERSTTPIVPKQSPVIATAVHKRRREGVDNVPAIDTTDDSDFVRKQSKNHSPSCQSTALPPAHPPPAPCAGHRRQGEPPRQGPAHGSQRGPVDVDPMDV